MVVGPFPVMMIVVMGAMVVASIACALVGQPADAGAEIVAELAFRNVRSRRRRALSLHMVVVAFLRQPDLVLETEHLGPVLAHGTVHRGVAGQDFAGPFGECPEHLRMVVQVAGLDEFRPGVPFRHNVGEAVDPVHQHAGEQEIGEDDDAAVAELGRMIEARFNQGKRNTRIAGLAPAESKPFPQQAGDLRDIGVGVRVRCAASDDNEAGLLRRNPVAVQVRGGKCFPDPVGRGGDHLWIDAEFTPVFDPDSVFTPVGVQHRGDVVLGVHCRKQHARNRKNAPAAGIPQSVEAGSDDRVGEFKVAVLNRPVGELLRHLRRHCGKLADRPLRAGAVAA